MMGPTIGTRKDILEADALDGAPLGFAMVNFSQAKRNTAWVRNILQPRLNYGAKNDQDSRRTWAIRGVGQGLYLSVWSIAKACEAVVKNKRFGTRRSPP